MKSGSEVMKSKAASKAARTILTTIALCSASTGLSGMLTIYAIPSPRGINWRTPKSLTWTTLSNQTADDTHKIGHANVHVKCERAQGDYEDFEFLSGMTTDGTDPSVDLIRRDGFGLGILFTTLPGRLESEEEITRDLNRRFTNGRLSYIQFKINSDTCGRLAKYADDYRRYSFDQFYGLANRPRSGEGAGCTAFAASFLDLAGLHTSKLRKGWAKTRLVPEHLVGGPQTGDRVPVLRLLRPLRQSRWAHEKEPHFKIDFFDPDALHESIVKAWDSKQDPVGLQAVGKRSRIKAAKGFLFDASSVATPTDPIWSF